MEADGDRQTQESMLEVSKKLIPYSLVLPPLQKGHLMDCSKQHQRNLGKKTGYKDLYLEPRVTDNHYD